MIQKNLSISSKPK